MNRRRHIVLAGLGLAGLPLAGTALAQGKPMRIVVGFPAGGSSDALARLLAEALRTRIDAPVLVENRAGAGGRLGIEAVKAAEADGSVMLITPNPMITMYPHLYKRLAYDPQKDLVPVGRLATFPLFIGVGPSVPASVKNIKDLMQWFKANPDKAFYGTPGPGSTPHFIGMMLGKAAGVPLTHAAYKGDAPAIQDLLGGQIAMSVNTPAAQLPHVPGGRLRVLATTGAQRSPQLPDVPTLVESGFNIVTRDWFGAFVPAATPAPVVQRLQAQVREALNTKEVQDGLAKLQLQANFAPPQEFARLIREDTEQWGPVIRESGFTPDD
ncbi:Bug family tripartite tricarboxylate transporter substrate binding protein [Aquabacterium sp. J223]|uniref:Bug family tripartite tricarboxylate transporter substrate binding protein n=1 Tax=Aquabacterium sp. J223 TaxID=2898431 RepID=UPI0021AE08C8|nr:Bug family tripartite tricarboxylate transporter substrate binding protein [Aquabacterium sp. J223]UUX94472.1 Bug family tripartite tricarboxylate transporter substrate binding protein [Aquabacterium sp. J223]